MSHDFPVWHKEARCQSLPQEMFFGPEQEESTSKRHRPMLTMSEVKRAKAVCDRCPVRKMCLEFALINHEEYGIWGGSTTAERKDWWKKNEAAWAQKEVLDLT